MIRFLIHWLLFLLFITVHCCVLSQESDTANLYHRVVGIDGNTMLDNRAKLTALYSLKTKAETGSVIHDSGYITTLIKLAKYEWLQNKNYALAAQYNLQALALIAASKNAVSNDIKVNAYHNQGFYCYQMLLYNKALAYYDTVALLCKNRDPYNYMAEARHSKTLIYFYVGDYQKVIDESTLGVYNVLQKKDSLYYVSFLNCRAYALMYQGKTAQAFADINTAIIIAKKQMDFYELANVYKTKAILFDKEKKYADAESLFKQSIAVRPHVNTEFETIANDYNDLANFYTNSLNDYAKAKLNYNIAIRYAAKCDSLIRNMVLFMAHSNLAQVATKQHLYSQAAQCYKLALSSIHIQTKDALLMPVAAKQLALISNKNVLFPFLFGKTHLLLQLYKTTQKEAYLTACLQMAMLTDTLITQTRHENLGEGSKLYWRNETRNFFDHALQACYLAKDVNKAFYFMEKSRAVLLNDKLNALGAAALIPLEEKSKEEVLQANVVEKQQRLGAFSAGTKSYEDQYASLLQSQNELEQFVKALEHNYPAYYRYKYADNVPTLQSFQQYLAASHQSFVYYFMSDTAVYALGIMPGNTTFIQIASKDFNTQQLSDFLSFCSHKEKLNNNYQLFAASAYHIYNQLFKPLQLPAGNVAVCTDNFLIPFEALCADANGQQFLLYNYTFSYVYSAGTLMKPFESNTPASGNFVGFAPVNFAKKLQLLPLTQSSEALLQTADFYKNHQLFTQQAATRSNFFGNAARYAVVTVFSHARADTSGMEPVLYMHDSAIHLSELPLLKNASAQLVLLSACQTNIGKNATGEGIYSLARGFAAAGIPAIAATLWKADEQTIYRISAKYNAFLAAGMPKSEALQKAKLWFITNSKTKEHVLPYYWANMVLIGNTGPVNLVKENYNWLWITVVAAGMFALFIVVVLKLKKGYSKAMQ